MKRILPRLSINPIIVKELRSRMRGPRPFITLTIILLVTGGILFALLQIILAGARYSTVMSAQVGQGMFAALMFMELFMVCVITPAVTAGSISSEREHQTYEMLMATPLSPTRVLWGKLISAMSYVFLLLFAAIPLASMVFIFGGIAPSDMLRPFLILMVIAFTVGVIGLFFSTIFKRTGWAIVAAFIAVIGLTFAPIFIGVLVSVLIQGEPPRWLLAPSPLSAMSAAMSASMGAGNDFNSIFYLLGGMWWNMGIGAVSQTEIPRPLYHYSIVFYGGLSLLLGLLATRFVQPARRFAMRRKEALIGLGMLLSFCVVVAGLFLVSAGRYEWALSSGLMPVPEEVNFRDAPPSAIVQAYPVDPSKAQITLVPDTQRILTQDDLDPATQGMIYAEIARRLIGEDNTFGGQPAPWKTVYLVSTTNDRVGDPNSASSDSMVLPEGVMNQIVNELDDLPQIIQWTQNEKEVARSKADGTIDGGEGAQIFFGNIHPQEDGTLQVPASLYFSSLGATGKTYVLTFVEGKWIITSTTGVEWIS